MFTGLVQYQGQLLSLVRGSPSLLTLKAPLPASLAIGDSVAVNGACLTVVAIDGDRYGFNLSEETLRISTFAELTPFSDLNLEMAMTLNDRLGGHLVSGHLDGVARVKGMVKNPGSTSISLVTQGSEWNPFMISKGSITLNGVSLTIGSVKGQGFCVDVIPHTLAVTNLKKLRIGERVNVELDLIGKYLYNFYLKRQT